MVCPVHVDTREGSASPASGDSAHGAVSRNVSEGCSFAAARWSAPTNGDSYQSQEGARAEPERVAPCRGSFDRRLARPGSVVVGPNGVVAQVRLRSPFLPLVS